MTRPGHVSPPSSVRGCRLAQHARDHGTRRLASEIRGAARRDRRPRSLHGLARVVRRMPARRLATRDRGAARRSARRARSRGNQLCARSRAVSVGSTARKPRRLERPAQRLEDASRGRRVARVARKAARLCGGSLPARDRQRGRDRHVDDRVIAPLTRALRGEPTGRPSTPRAADEQEPRSRTMFHGASFFVKSRVWLDAASNPCHMTQRFLVGESRGPLLWMRCRISRLERAPSRSS